ncbi:unnamed protein product [Phyllotreta striolata]|uniref:Uncharacterized protein n=1 Tax=Phyllotreta striolata TaxID=444603 RepID=A0A9N9TZ11_PHYSR|nr:unnamed protein product [Phyllotreta striolata]
MQRKSVSPSKFRPLQISQSPVATSPGKNLTGPARVARDITADLFNTVQVWNDNHIKGAQIVRDIALLKGDNLDEYSKGLEDCTNNLHDLVQKLNSCVELFSKYRNQIAALKKVERRNDPLFISLSISDIERLIIVIVEGYLEEFKVNIQCSLVYYYNIYL